MRDSRNTDSISSSLSLIFALYCLFLFAKILFAAESFVLLPKTKRWGSLEIRRVFHRHPHFCFSCTTCFSLQKCFLWQINGRTTVLKARLETLDLHRVSRRASHLFLPCIARFSLNKNILLKYHSFIKQKGADLNCTFFYFLCIFDKLTAG